MWLSGPPFSRTHLNTGKIMTRDTEDQIMGWYIIMMIVLAVIAIANATPTPSTKTCECTEVQQ
mgnify:CR=1 FL=1